VRALGVDGMPEGKMTLLSTTALQRMADAPDLPTLDEQGAKGYDAPVLPRFNWSSQHRDGSTRLNRRWLR
jgi:hypothetical protein